MPRYATLLLSTLFCGTITVNAQNFAPFSELVGLGSYGIQMIPAPDGGYLSLVHLNDPADGAFTVYAINEAGHIAHSLPLFNDQDRHICSQILEYEGRYFLTGNYNVRYTGSNYEAFRLSQRKFLMEVNAQLDLLGLQYFDVFEDKTWLWGPGTNQASPQINVNNPGSHFISNDTLYAAQVYLRVQYDDTPQGLVLTAFDKIHQFEKLGLNGEIYNPGLNLDNVSFFFSSAFTENSFFIFGDVGGTGIGGGGTLDVNALGIYDLNGASLDTYAYDGNGSGLFTTGSTGQYHSGVLYTTYYAAAVSDVPGCAGPTAAVDVRNPAGFTSISRFKLPLCDVYSGCKEPFLFQNDGSFYYLGWSLNEPAGPVTLFRYNSNYTLSGFTTLNVPNHRPLGIYAAGEDAVVIACMDWSSGNFNNTTLALFKIQTGDLLSTESHQGIASHHHLFPNPFTRYLYSHSDGNTWRQAEIRRSDGTVAGHTKFSNGYTDLSYLSPGMYFMVPLAPNGEPEGAPVRVVKSEY